MEPIGESNPADFALRVWEADDPGRDPVAIGLSGLREPLFEEMPLTAGDRVPGEGVL